jgi:hypothetical protein
MSNFRPRLRTAIFKESGFIPLLKQGSGLADNLSTRRFAYVGFGGHRDEAAPPVM